MILKYWGLSTGNAELLMFHFSTKAICFANIFPNTAPIDTKLTFL